jgi:uncharacterized membrane protein
MIDVVLYSRPGCHLCDEARQRLDELQAVVPHRLTIIDIDQDDELQKAYTFEIPVINIGPYKLKAPIDPKDLEITLRAAEHRNRQIADIDRSIETGQTSLELNWTGSDKFSVWLSRHYLAVLNILVLIYLGLPFLAPVLMNVGWVTPANWIYRAYSVVCHQLPYRSFFLFGEQNVYPREMAEVEGVLSFEDVSDLNANDLLNVRTFIGDEHLGFKVALCERDVAIYAGILLFGLMFGAANRRFPRIPWYLWVLLALVPIGVDGLSQLFSQFFLSLPPRESTPLLRSLTGFAFGFVSCWYFYPMVEDSMKESLDYLQVKYQRYLKQRAWRGQAGA